MPTPAEPRREHPSTYIVQNRSSEEELTRLQIQDRVVTRGMGGVLAEQSNIEALQRVLDVGCGTGGWLLDVAQAYPTLTLLNGVDVSLQMVEYARQQASEQQVSDRVEFQVMDALRRLEFPADFFDLVNHRLSSSYLRTWDWPKLLQEYQRVCKRGGIVRVSELDAIVENTSPALTQLMGMFTQAFRQAGHFFASDSHGVTGELPRLLRQAGLENVQTRSYMLVHRAGTHEGQIFFENMKLVYRTAVPFLQKWVRLPDDYEQIYQQMLSELQQPDFTATWHMLTAWGINVNE